MKIDGRLLMGLERCRVYELFYFVKQYHIWKQALKSINNLDEQTLTKLGFEDCIRKDILTRVYEQKTFYEERINMVNKCLEMAKIDYDFLDILLAMTSCYELEDIQKTMLYHDTNTEVKITSKFYDECVSFFNYLNNSHY